MSEDAYFERLRECLAAHDPSRLVTLAEAKEAFNNLAGFVRTLIEINKQLNIVDFGGAEEDDG